MGWILIYFFVCLLLPLQGLANEENPDKADTANVESDEEFEIRDEDKELIAELELIELLDLLENMNALASMEDTE